MKKVFIGIDFSKSTFDVAMFNSDKIQEVKQNKFANSVQGCQEMLTWLNSMTKISRKYWLFCGEHTGLYSLTLCTFLVGKKLDIWLESALQLKQSQGITRDKSDKIDAKRIAEYAFRFQDKMKIFSLSSKVITDLQDLMAYRERLISIRTILLVSAKELKSVKNNDDTADFIFMNSCSQIEDLSTKIDEIEAKVFELVSQDEEIKQNYDIVTSIKGIGFVNAISIIIATNNFQNFDDPRKFSCYCGSAPFGKSSGTSVRVKEHVSHIANKKLKSFLTQAAQCAVQHNKVFKEYYLRKKNEGKEHFLIINNVRNKLIHLMFALVKTKTKYDIDYQNPLKKIA